MIKRSAVFISKKIKIYTKITNNRKSATTITHFGQAGVIFFPAYVSRKLLRRRRLDSRENVILGPYI